MAREYEATVDVHLSELFYRAFCQSMEEQGFRPSVRVSSMRGERVAEFQRGDQVVTLEERGEAHDQRRIRVSSQSLDVDEIVGVAVSDAATGLLAAFGDPFSGYGLKRLQKELGKSIQRPWSRLPGKRKA